MGLVPGLNCGHYTIYLNVSNNLLLKIESDTLEQEKNIFPVAR